MTDENKTPGIPDPEKIVADSDFEILHYSIDKEGNWNSKLLANWGAKEIITTQTWVIVQERLNAAKEKVLKGEMSPIGFYMVKCIMDIKLCAQFTGLSVWKVKKHMRPCVFINLKPDVLKRYADAFEISVDDMTQLREKLNQETKSDV
jgi:hypothetical protein